MKILTVGIGEVAGYVSQMVFRLDHEATQIYWGDNGDFVGQHGNLGEYDGILIEVNTPAYLAKAQEFVESLGLFPERYVFFSSVFSPLSGSMSEVGVCYLNILGKIQEEYGKLNYLSSEKKRQWVVGDSLGDFPETPDLRWPVVGDEYVLEELPEAYRKTYAPGDLTTRLGESWGYVGVCQENKLIYTYLALSLGTVVWLSPEEATTLGASFQIIKPSKIEAFSNSNIRQIQHNQVSSLRGKIPIAGEFEGDVEALLSKFEPVPTPVAKKAKSKTTKHTTKRIATDKE